jgi:hypothetical protein
VTGRSKQTQYDTPHMAGVAVDSFLVGEVRAGCLTREDEMKGVLERAITREGI